MSTDTPIMPSDADRAYLRACHLTCMHQGRPGRVWIGRKSDIGTPDERWEGETVALADATLSPHFATADYLSVNTFGGKRRLTSTVASCASIGLDFDFYRENLPHAGLEPEAIVALLVAAMDAAGVPRPSYVLFSGRGVQVVWICHHAGPNALARVRAVYEMMMGPLLATNGKPIPVKRRRDARLDAVEARLLPMWQVFRDCGLDRVVRDGARVLRLAGSVHATSGRVARLLSPATFDDVERLSFHTIAAAVLPYTQEEIRALREARAAGADVDEEMPAQAAKRSDGKRRTGKSGGVFRSAVLSDLQRMIAAGLVGPKSKRRELVLFHMANSAAHVRGGTIDEWVESFAPAVGLSKAEARSALSNLGRRAERHERGEKVAHGKREWTPLYHHRRETIMSDLRITQEEADTAGLRVLRPSGSIVKTPAERKKDERDRKNPNRTTHDRKRWLRNQMGIDAMLGRAEGETMAETAADFGVTVETVRKAMTEVAKVAGLPDISVASCKRYVEHLFWAPGAIGEAPAPAVVEPTISMDTSNDEAKEKSHYIVPRRAVPASPVRAAPKAPPAPPVVQPGEVVVERYTACCARVHTASGTWDWWRYKDVLSIYGATEWFEEWDRRTPGIPTQADELLAEAARRDLSSASSSRSSRPARRPGRVASERRPAATQRSRRMGFRSLPPLDADRAADAYRFASQGY